MNQETPYRENVRPARGERANRKLDYLLYVAPFKRLGFVLLVLAPWIFAGAVSRMIFSSDGGLSAYFLGPVFYLIIGLIPGLALAFLVNAEKNPKKFILEVAWWPLALLWHLARWILLGRR
jgi:hypothetical protein